jgi:hypothetical protein
MTKPIRPPSTRSQTIYCRVSVEGRTIDATASEFNITGDTVKRVLRGVRRWMKLGCQGVPKPSGDAAHGEALRDLHVARLEHQWNEVMAAWYRSKQPEETDKAVVDDRKQVKGEKTRRSQTGEVKYLTHARAIMAEIRQLDGTSQRVEPVEPGHVADATPEQRETSLDQIVDGICQRTGTTPDGRPDYGNHNQPRAA